MPISFYCYCRFPNFIRVHKVSRERKINIPQEIGNKYYMFGILLLHDLNGTIVHSIEHKYKQNAEQINLEICREWVRLGGGASQ